MKNRNMLIERLIANARATRKNIWLHYYRIADGIYNTLNYVGIDIKD